jgi:hypothetical protein
MKRERLLNINIVINNSIEMTDSERLQITEMLELFAKSPNKRVERLYLNGNTSRINGFCSQHYTKVKQPFTALQLGGFWVFPEDYVTIIMDENSQVLERKDNPNVYTAFHLQTEFDQLVNKLKNTVEVYMKGLTDEPVMFSEQELYDTTDHIIGISKKGIYFRSNILLGINVCCVDELMIDTLVKLVVILEDKLN